MDNERDGIINTIGKYQLWIFLILIVIISLITMQLILSYINIIYPQFPDISDMYLILNTLIQYQATIPVVVLSIIYFLCPAIVAVIMLEILNGREGISNLFKGLLKWRSGVQWYIVAIFLPIVIEILTVAFNMLFGNHVPSNYIFSLLPWNINVPRAISPSQIASLTPNSIIVVEPWNINIPVIGTIPGAILIPIFMLIWSIGLAIGLYGYALPRLLKSYNPLVSAAILGIYTVLITLPLLINNPNIAIMAVGLFALTFLAVWLYNSTNSILLVAIFLFFSEYMPNIITYYIAHFSEINLPVYINKAIIIIIAGAIVVLYKDYFLGKSPTSKNEKNKDNQ